MATTPPDRLTAAADIFRQRNQQYGDSFLSFGQFAHAMFPDGLSISSPEQWNRFALFFMCMTKLHRYGGKFNAGGQADSLDDLAVYSQMLAYVDELNQEPAQ